MGSAVSYELADPHQYRHLGPPPMLIEGFLPAASIMGLTALPGVGKSWLVLEAMRAVATGGKFLGEFQSEQGGVLFVGNDASLYDYARQWRRLTQLEYLSHHEAGEEGVAPNIPYDSVRWLIQSPFLFEDPKEVCNLIKTHQTFEHGEPEPVFEWRTESDPNDPELGVMSRHQIDMACAKGFKLIVFDTLSRLTRAQQNDNTEMERVFGNIRLICDETKAAVILVHHNSKPSEFNDGSDWRGAMAQIGALDSWVNIATKKNEKEIIAATFKKFRGITPGNFRFRMNVTDEETASLIYLDTFDSHFDESADGPLPLAIRGIMATAPAEGMTINEIAVKLHATFIEDFAELDKFKRAVRNRLSEKGSPLMQQFIELVPKTGSGANHYRLKETPDASTT
jgi:hypothetical protein